MSRMTKQEKVKKARKWVRDIQKVLPSCQPVTLTGRPTTSRWGATQKTRKGFNIYVNWDWSWAVIETWILPHEYAHTRVWGRIQSLNEDHDGHFHLEVGVVDEAADLLPVHEVT